MWADMLSVNSKESDYLRWGNWAVPRRVTTKLQTDEDSEIAGVISASFELRDGVPVCTSFYVVLGERLRPIDRPDLSFVPNISLERIATDAFINEIRLCDDEGQALRDLGPQRAEVQRAAWFALRRMLRYGKEFEEAEHLLEVARVFLSDEKTPLRAVEREFHVSTPTASRWVNKAREAGLVPPKRSPLRVRRKARERLEALLMGIQGPAPSYRLADAVDDPTAETFRTLLRTEGREAAYAYLWKAVATELKTEDGKTVRVMWGNDLAEALCEDLKARREEEGGGEDA